MDALLQGMSALERATNGDDYAWRKWCAHGDTTKEEIAAVRHALDATHQIFIAANVIDECT